LQLNIKVARQFVRGEAILLLDNPELSPARPTDDFDVILETVTAQRYSDVEAKLRHLGFANDMREKAPKCRWVLGNLTVDIMPTEAEFLGLNTAWFKEALATATEREFAQTKLKLISPVDFLATKHVALIDHGDGDYYASQDLEDFVTVIDGLEMIVAEVNEAPVECAVTRSSRFGAWLPSQLSAKHCPGTCRRTTPVSNDCRIFAANFRRSRHDVFDREPNGGRPRARTIPSAYPATRPCVVGEQSCSGGCAVDDKYFSEHGGNRDKALLPTRPGRISAHACRQTARASRGWSAEG
jgi:hypothetical protein